MFFLREILCLAHVTPAFLTGLTGALGSHRTQTKQNSMLTCNPLDLVGVAQGVNEAGIWLKFGGLAESAQEAEMLERNWVKVSSCAPVPVPSSAGLCPNSPAQSWCSRPQAWLHVCHHLFVQVSYWLLCVVTKCLVGGHSVVAGPPSQQGLGLFEDPSWGHPEWCNIEKLGLFVARFPLFVAREYFIPTLIHPYCRNRRPSLFPCFEEWVSDVFR